MSETEGAKLTLLDTKTMSPPARKFYEFLSSRVKGQDRALKEVVGALELQMSGIDRGNRPKFVGLFLGPSGVGKTLVAEALAESFFGDRKAFTKIEGATYSQPHQVALLIGSPPGYIGFNQEGNSAYPLLSQFNIDKHGYLAYQFTPEAVARDESIKGINNKLHELAKSLTRMKASKKDNTEEYKNKLLEFRKLKVKKEKLEEEKTESRKKLLAGGEPQFDSILLVDEIEKAHLDVWNTLLEITDKGRLTLSNGNVTDFRRCYIIITSNVGSGEIKDVLSDAHVGFKIKTDNGEVRDGKEKDQEIYNVAREAAKATFPPEFLGRLDTVVVFRHLGREAMREIFNVQKLELMNELNTSGIYIQLNIDDEVTDFIIYQATKRSDYGARLLKHRIDEYIKMPLARLKNWGKEKGIIKGDIVDVKLEKVDEKNRLAFYRHERTDTLGDENVKPEGVDNIGKLEVLDVDPEDSGELLNGNNSE